MDIEGFEYSVLSRMLQEKSAMLPSQIAFELHWQTQMTSLSWHRRTKTAGEIASLARALYDAGYRTLSRSDNKRCPHCTELNVFRLFCARSEEADRVEPALRNEAALLTAWGPDDPGEGCAGGVAS